MACPSILQKQIPCLSVPCRCGRVPASPVALSGFSQPHEDASPAPVHFAAGTEKVPRTSEVTVTARVGSCPSVPPRAKDRRPRLLSLALGWPMASAVCSCGIRPCREVPPGSRRRWFSLFPRPTPLTTPGRFGQSCGAGRDPLFHIQWLFLTGPSKRLSIPARVKGACGGQGGPAWPGDSPQAGGWGVACILSAALLFLFLFSPPPPFFFFKGSLYKEDKRIYWGGKRMHLKRFKMWCRLQTSH